MGTLIRIANDEPVLLNARDVDGSRDSINLTRGICLD